MKFPKMFFLTIFLVNFYLYFNPKTLMTENQCPTQFFIYSHQTQTFFSTQNKPHSEKIPQRILYDKSTGGSDLARWELNPKV